MYVHPLTEIPSGLSVGLRFLGTGRTTCAFSIGQAYVESGHQKVSADTCNQDFRVIDKMLCNNVWHKRIAVCTRDVDATEVNISPNTKKSCRSARLSHMPSANP